jgi:hypothetical protein
MILSDAEVDTETSKRELGVRPARRGHPGKKINPDVKICKHLAPGGWCSKKHQRCPLLNLLFINQ